MGYEVAEQLEWKLPRGIIYPTGGGVGMIGMWKAFDEMEELGWIGSERPKMITVQAAGCAPIVKAWEAGKNASGNGQANRGRALKPLRPACACRKPMAII